MASHDIDRINSKMQEFLKEYPFIQYMYITDINGYLLTWNVSNIEDLSKYQQVDPGTNLSDREWFILPVKTGKLHITDFYKSHFTGKLCLTASIPVFSEHDEILAILGADIRFDELVKIQEDFAFEQNLLSK